MAMIVTDRFLEVYLNIQHNVHWSPKKTKFILTAALAICIFSPLFITDLKNLQIVGKMLIYCVVPKLELFFFCYCFLCVSLHHKGCFKTSQKCKASTRKQLQENYVVVHHRQPNTRFKLLVPTLIHNLLTVYDWPKYHQNICCQRRHV